MLLALAGCGRLGFDNPGDGGAGGLTVHIRSAPATILPLATMRFSAVVDGNVNQAAPAATRPLWAARST